MLMSINVEPDLSEESVDPLEKAPEIIFII